MAKSVGQRISLPWITRNARFPEHESIELAIRPRSIMTSSKRVWAQVRSRAFARLAVVLCAFALVASCHDTPIGTVTNFPRTGINGPQGIVAGPDGNIWFTNRGNNSIGRITPAGVVSNFTDTPFEPALGWRAAHALDFKIDRAT
jgi:streptogramin lyase